MPEVDIYGNTIKRISYATYYKHLNAVQIRLGGGSTLVRYQSFSL